MLVDSHCHLNYPELKDQLPEAIARAAKAGVTHMQTISTKLNEFDEVYAIAEAYENVFASVGVHPHYTEDETASLEQLLEHASKPKVIGIGETGLDYFYEYSNREVQRASFLTHIEASRQTGLPLIIHTRSADDETVEILEEEYANGAFPILIHCFSTDKKVAECAIRLGGYVSISGIVTFKKATELQQAVKELPLERLLVETDSPYLAPVPHRGKPCEPAFTRHTAEFIAELRGETLEAVAAQTTQNFYTLFDKAVRA